MESETKIFSTSKVPLIFQKIEAIQYCKMLIFNDSKSSLKSNVTFWIQFYISFMIFFLNFCDLQPFSMCAKGLAWLRSYPILAIFWPKRPSAAHWARLGCLQNNFPYYFNIVLAFGRCRHRCEKKLVWYLFNENAHDCYVPVKLKKQSIFIIFSHRIYIFLNI